MNPNLQLTDVLNFAAAEIMKAGGPDRVAQNLEIGLALLFTHGIPQIAHLFSAISSIFS